MITIANTNVPDQTPLLDQFYAMPFPMQLIFCLVVLGIIVAVVVSVLKSVTDKETNKEYLERRHSERAKKIAYNNSRKTNNKKLRQLRTV